MFYEVVLSGVVDLLTGLEDRSETEDTSNLQTNDDDGWTIVLLEERRSNFEQTQNTNTRRGESGDSKNLQSLT